MPESVEGPAMNRSGRLPIDTHFRIGHAAFKDDLDRPSLPGGGYLKLVPIGSLLIGEAAVLSIGLVIPAIIVSAETLLLPARGDGDLRPCACAAAFADLKIPGYRVGGICA